jgi:DHA3 family tetracycline resistance protein-like MFS transporter
MDAYRLHLIRAGMAALVHSIVWTAMMVYQVETVGLTPLQLVLVGTTMEATIFLFEVPTGIVADIYSRRLSAVIGFAMIGGAYLVAGAFPVFAAIIGSQVIWGIGYTFTSGAYEAWLVDEIGQERAGEAFIRAGQVSRVLGLAGVAISVGLGAINLQLPVLAGGGLMLLMAIFLLFNMPETGFAPTPREDRSTFGKMADTFRDGIKVVRGRPKLIYILAIGVFVGLYSEGWDRLWQLHLIDTIGLPAVGNLPTVAWFGLINVASTGVAVLAAEGMRRRLDMNNELAVQRAIFIINGLMVGGLVFYGLSGSFALAMGAWFMFSIPRGLAHPVMQTWTNAHIDKQVRATVLSVQSQTDAIGQIAGGPPLGLIGQWSVRAAFFTSAGLLSPVLLLVHLVRRREVRNGKAAAAVEIGD